MKLKGLMDKYQKIFKLARVTIKSSNEVTKYIKKKIMEKNDTKKRHLVLILHLMTDKTMKRKPITKSEVTKLYTLTNKVLN